MFFFEVAEASERKCPQSSEAPPELQFYAPDSKTVWFGDLGIREPQGAKTDPPFFNRPGVAGAVLQTPLLLD